MKLYRVAICKYLNGENYDADDYYVFADNVEEAKSKALDEAQCENEDEFDELEICDIEDLGDE